MNFKSLQLFVLILLTSIMGAVPYLEAHADQVLVPLIVVTDDWVDQKQAIICGKAADTPSGCQEAFRNCEAGIDRIMDNAHSVCSQQPSECKVIDVTATQFSQTAYNLLVRTPIDNYTNSAEAAGLKNCNAHPPIAPLDPAAEEARKKQQEQMNAELGLPPVAAEAGTAPAANANNGQVVEPAAPAPAPAAPVAPDAPKQEATGGCSLNTSH